jgi:hypothetical protein
MQTVVRHHVSLLAPDRQVLLTGLDDIAGTQLKYQETVDRCTAADRLKRPWMWLQQASESSP